MCHKGSKTHNSNVKKFFIHTCNLSSVHPFGLDVFQKNCAVNKLSRSLTFTGDHGDAMAPPGSNLPDDIWSIYVKNQRHDKYEASILCNFFNKDVSGHSMTSGKAGGMCC